MRSRPVTISCLSQRYMEVRSLHSSSALGLKISPQVGQCSTGTAFIEEFLHACTYKHTNPRIPTYAYRKHNSLAYRIVEKQARAWTWYASSACAAKFTTGESRADFTFRHGGTDTRMLVTCSFWSHCLAFVVSRLVLPVYLATPMKRPSYVDNEWITLVACACICACTPRLSQPCNGL